MITNLKHKDISLVTRKLYRRAFSRRAFQVQKVILSVPERSYSFKPLFSNISQFGDEIIFTTANKITLGNYYFLGLNISSEPIPDWHKDYLTGFTWPLVPHNEVRGITPPGVDIKNAWEFSSLFHLLPVSAAYACSKDTAYLTFIVDQLKSWSNDNPAAQGVNWSSPMNVAFRLMQMVELFSTDIDEVLPRDFVSKIESMIWEHLLFLMNNLENLSHCPGNHYLSNLVGVIWGSLFFSEKNLWVRHMRVFARKAMNRELLRQVNSDGMNFEGSTGYHRLVTEMFLYTAILLNKNNISVPPVYLEVLGKMLTALRSLALPDGRLPLIGDSDDCRLFWGGDYFTKERATAGYLLNIAAHFLVDPNLASVDTQGRDLSTWIWGLTNHHKHAGADSRRESVALENSQIYICGNEDDRLIINCNQPGETKCGHSHNDTLSFILCLDGAEVFVDPGSYVYTRDLDARNLFRSTRFHNVLQIDDEEQWPIPKDAAFLLPKRQKPEVILWSSNETEDTFIGEHYGYLRLPEQIIHRRKFSYMKSQNTILIKDSLVSLATGKTTCDLCVKSYFHLSEQFNAELSGNEATIVRPADGKPICLLELNSELPVNVTTQSSWVSRSYGVKEESMVVVFEGQVRIPWDAEYKITKL